MLCRTALPPCHSGAMLTRGTPLDLWSPRKLVASITFRYLSTLHSRGHLCVAIMISYLVSKFSSGSSARHRHNYSLSLCSCSYSRTQGTPFYDFRGWKTQRSQRYSWGGIDSTNGERGFMIPETNRLCCKAVSRIIIIRDSGLDMNGIADRYMCGHGIPLPHRQAPLLTCAPELAFGAVLRHTNW